MRKLLYFILILSLLFPRAVMATGAVSFDVAPVFTDNMVLQADREIVIYGTSPDEGASLLVYLEEEKREAKIHGGEWEARFPKREAGGEPFAIQVIGGGGGEHIFIENVTVGDVWLVLGQSNVEFNATALPEWDEKSQLLPKNARLLTYTSLDLGEKPAGARARMWRPMTWLSAAQASALGVLLTEGISISTGFIRPIGLISAGFKGQELAAFLPEEIAKDMETAEEETSRIYNAVLKGLSKFPIKGLVWYQGEANGMYYKDYVESFAEFIGAWREAAGHFPVYIVELAPCFMVENEAQAAERQYLDFGTVRGVIGTLPMYLTDTVVCPQSDLFADRAYPNSLHPPNKTALSQRVLASVLEGSYGIGNGKAAQIVSVDFGETEKEVVLTFSAPIMAHEGEIRGFSAIDKDWNPAEIEEITIEGESVRLRAASPVCIVRYGAQPSDVFGETLTLTDMRGMPVPAIWYKLSEPDKPGALSFALLYIVHYLSVLWPLLLLAAVGGGVFIYRKKRKKNH